MARNGASMPRSPPAPLILDQVQGGSPRIEPLTTVNSYKHLKSTTLCCSKHMVFERRCVAASTFKFGAHHAQSQLDYILVRHRDAAAAQAAQAIAGCPILRSCSSCHPPTYIRQSKSNWQEAYHRVYPAPRRPVPTSTFQSNGSLSRLSQGCRRC